MNLYGLMTNVCAGAGHERVAQGAFGIVTLWLRAASVQNALDYAERLRAKREYEWIGGLSTYLEEAADSGLKLLCFVARVQRISSITTPNLLRIDACTQANGPSLAYGAPADI